MRACLDIIDFAQDLLDVIPDWHEAERHELQARMKTLGEIATKSLQTQPGAR